MIQQLFSLSGISALILLITAALLIIIPQTRKTSIYILSSAIIIQASYMIWLWGFLDRPPIRTLGETRLWYAFFLSILSLLFWIRWKLQWLLIYANLMAALFLLIDLLNPKALDQTLMPALQSVWFVPHVIVYMMGYALLGVSALSAAYIIVRQWQRKPVKTPLSYADQLVYLGFAFLTLGLVFGALWAKKAWGHYWTWDPKETWALITWMAYLMYIHIRHRHPEKEKAATWILALAFVFLIICWFGVNYLPSAQNSVHTY